MITGYTGGLWDYDDVRDLSNFIYSETHFPVEFCDTVASYVIQSYFDSGKFTRGIFEREHTSDSKRVQLVFRRCLIRSWRAYMKIIPHRVTLRNKLQAMSNKDLETMWDALFPLELDKRYNKLSATDWAEFVYSEITYRRAMNPQEW